MPTNANAFRPIINAFVNQLASAGYGRTYLYTYLNYANSRLNANDLRARIGWMAQYSYQLSYDFHSGYSDVRGWQYTSIDRISGVSGNVDMSAFDQRIFSDVNWKTPHLQDIAWAKSSKVTDGFPNGTFRGMNTVVRQDMAAFLRRVAVRHNIAGAKTWKPSAADWNRFTDVDPGTPHAADILWLAHAGIADGYDNGNGTQRYEGMAPMYRQDMAAFLYRLAKKANKLGNVRPMSFTDVNASTPHYQEVQWLGVRVFRKVTAMATGHGVTRVWGICTVRTWWHCCTVWTLVCSWRPCISSCMHDAREIAYNTRGRRM